MRTPMNAPAVAGGPGHAARARSMLLGLVVGLASGAGVVALAGPTGPITDPPRVIPYDGYLTLADGPVNDTVSLRFGLHPSADCEACEMWTETQEVPVHGGRFSVGLGAVTPLAAALMDQKLWLSLEVDGSPLAGRQALEPVPYAHWTAGVTSLTAARLVPEEGSDQVTIDHSVVHVLGNTIELGTDDGLDRGSSARQRTLLRTEDGGLLINPDGDFEGGVRIETTYYPGGATLLEGASAPNIQVQGLTADTVSITGTKTVQGGNYTTTAVPSPSFNSEWADCGAGVVTAVDYEALDTTGTTRRVVLKVSCK